MSSRSSLMTYALDQQASERRYTAYEILANHGMTPNGLQSRFFETIKESSPLPSQFMLKGHIGIGKKMAAFAHAIALASQKFGREILFTVPDTCDRIGRVRETSIIAEHSHLLRESEIRRNRYYLVLNNSSCLSFRTVREILGRPRDDGEISKYYTNIILDAHNMRHKDVVEVAWGLFGSARTLIVSDD